MNYYIRHWQHIATIKIDFYNKIKWNTQKSGFLAVEVAQQTVKGPVWFLLTASNKMQEEGAELKKELLSKKEAALQYLENFQSLHFTHTHTKVSFF